jgi:hypothetical protein
LEVSWYKFEQAMAQALREAGPPPITGAVLPAAWSAVEAAAARAGNQVAPPPTDRPHASEVGSRAPPLRVHLDASEVLESPPDWPQLPPPASSEPLAAYTERAVLRDPFFQEVEKRSVRAGFSPCRPGALRPATYTLEWWQSNYPKRSFTLTAVGAHPREVWHPDLRQLQELVFWRLIVELFERLRSGEFYAEGRRIDVVEGDTKVVAELWSNPNMLLLPRSEFQGKQRRGIRR